MRNNLYYIEEFNSFYSGVVPDSTFYASAQKEALMEIETRAKNYLLQRDRQHTGTFGRIYRGAPNRYNSYNFSIFNKPEVIVVLK